MWPLPMGWRCGTLRTISTERATSARTTSWVTLGGRRMLWSRRLSSQAGERCRRASRIVTGGMRPFIAAVRRGMRRGLQQSTYNCSLLVLAKTRLLAALAWLRAHQAPSTAPRSSMSAQGIASRCVRRRSPCTTHSWHGRTPTHPRARGEILRDLPRAHREILRDLLRAHREILRDLRARRATCVQSLRCCQDL